MSGATHSGVTTEVQSARPAIVALVIFVVLLLRLLHLSGAVTSPLTYHVGPDEDYYQRFGQAVAAGHGQDTPEFTFMDPAYGYVLGAIFRVFGFNLFVTYALQALLDTATAYGILVAGRLLGRPRAGLVGAILYGITGIAIEFSTSVLKEVWVSAFMTWWAVAALALVRGGGRRWRWLLFGAFCGFGAGLRSTLLLMGFMGLLLPLFAGTEQLSRRNRLIDTLLVGCGLIVALLPWSIRNHAAYGSLSPMSHNGGIVLAQIYNPDNLTGDMWIPGFVNYSHPTEIWRGYSEEASHRLGHTLTPPEVDHYWGDQAVSFMLSNPGRVAADMLHKLRYWLASTEIPSTRSDVEERMFSPVLRYLPPSGIWLFGLGFAGLLWFATLDRRWVIIATPLAVAFTAAIVFFAESRFRFHAASMLALSGGILVDLLLVNRSQLRQWRVAVFAPLAVALMVTSLVLGMVIAKPPIRWDAIAWGYIKMGNITQARAVIDRVSAQEPGNSSLIEAKGYIAAAQKRYADAADDLNEAIRLRPGSHLAHYNLARAYVQLGDTQRALREAKIAAQLKPSPDYDALVQQLSRQ